MKLLRERFGFPDNTEAKADSCLQTCSKNAAFGVGTLVEAHSMNAVQLNGKRGRVQGIQGSRVQVVFDNGWWCTGREGVLGVYEGERWLHFRFSFYAIKVRFRCSEHR